VGIGKQYKVQEIGWKSHLFDKYSTRFVIFSQYTFKVYVGTKGKSLEFSKKGTKIHSRYKRFWSSLQKEQNFTLVRYSNVDFASDIDDRTSTSGYLMNMGSTTISWNCKKQTTIANSSAKAEYISAWEATCEIVWLRRILQDLGETQKSPTTLLINNQSAIKMAKNPVFHSNMAKNLVLHQIAHHQRHHQALVLSI
jgi:hypothetical protein